LRVVPAGANQVANRTNPQRRRSSRQVNPRCIAAQGMPAGYARRRQVALNQKARRR